MFINIQGDVYRADCIVMIGTEGASLQIQVAGVTDLTEYEFDTEEEAQKAQFDAVQSWKRLIDALK